METYAKWADVPAHLKTKTQLGEMGKRLKKGQQPAARKRNYGRMERSHGEYLDLYDLNEAEDKKPTPAQLRALEKARMVQSDEKLLAREVTICYRHEFQTTLLDYLLNMQKYDTAPSWQYCDGCQETVDEAAWAAKLFDTPERYLILDTETTGLYNAEAIELAIINLQGETLLNTRLKPTLAIEAGAEAVHGITAEALANAPTFPEIYEQFQNIVKGKTLLIYNADFDTNILANMCRIYALPLTITTECVMLRYSAFWGDWSEYHGNYRWQKLPAGDHTALGDCLATLNVLQRMKSYYETEKGASNE